MTFSRLILMIVTGLFVGIQCVSSGKSLPSQDRKIVVQLEKTGCKGPCPVYTLTLYSDRTIVFEGKSNTLKQQTTTDQITKETFDQLLQQFTHEEFISMDSTFIDPIPDAPFIYLRFRHDEELKTVTNRGQAPQAFKLLVEKTEQIAIDAGWLPAKAADQMTMKEIIIELEVNADPIELTKLFADDRLILIRKITPNKTYYLFSIETENPELILSKLKENSWVKNAQWNHKLKRR